MINYVDDQSHNVKVEEYLSISNMVWVGMTTTIFWNTLYHGGSAGYGFNGRVITLLWLSMLLDVQGLFGFTSRKTSS